MKTAKKYWKQKPNKKPDKKPKIDADKWVTGKPDK